MRLESVLANQLSEQEDSAQRVQVLVRVPETVYYRINHKNRFSIAVPHTDAQARVEQDQMISIKVIYLLFPILIVVFSRLFRTYPLTFMLLFVLDQFFILEKTRSHTNLS